MKSLFPGSRAANRILARLEHGSVKTHELVASVSDGGRGGTTQGIYKSLRDLRHQGFVLVEKHSASLNQAWLRSVSRFVSQADYAYRNPANTTGHFLLLEDGDKITYSFKNPVQVDIFWNHVLYLLFDSIPVRHWVAYASHCWFLLGRRQEELILKEYMREKNISYLFTVAHRTPLDHAVAKDFDRVHSQYYMRPRPLFTNRSNYLGLVINIVGPYIIEAKYDKDTTDRLERFYKSHNQPTPAVLDELSDIIATPGHISFSIERNSHKSERLAKMFLKHFVI